MKKVYIICLYLSQGFFSLMIIGPGRKFNFLSLLFIFNVEKTIIIDSYSAYIRILYIVISKIAGAKRLTNFDQPTVWSIMTPLAIKTKSVNLVNIHYNLMVKDSHRGHLLTFISKPCSCLRKNVSNFIFSQSQVQSGIWFYSIGQCYRSISQEILKIDPENNIVTVNGGVEGLFGSILTFVEEGDEVIFLDSYQIVGGKAIGIPLMPKHQQSKSMILQRCKRKYFSNQDDDWEIDFPLQKNRQIRKLRCLFSAHLTILLGKEQVKRVCSLLEKFPKVIVVQDNVYEGMTFDYINLGNLKLLIKQQEMPEVKITKTSVDQINLDQNKTVSVIFPVICLKSGPVHLKGAERGYQSLIQVQNQKKNQRIFWRTQLNFLLIIFKRFEYFQVVRITHQDKKAEREYFSPKDALTDLTKNFNSSKKK